MVNENQNINGNDSGSKENFRVQLTNPMLYDRLHTLSAEYSVSMEALINEGVRRLIDDVDYVRSLRAGKAGLE